jgi:predicted extracellular nuclease
LVERARPRHRIASSIGLLLVVAGMLPFAAPVAANDTTQSLPFAQAWSNTGLITVNDDWSSVPGIVGYRGDALTSTTAVDPQTVTADGAATPVDVNANLTAPNTFATGGVSEFEMTDPVVAFQGSGTARAPHLVASISTSGLANVGVSYTLRDIDGSADNAIQPVALQYRVGNTGSYTNVPAGFVADASTGPSLATLTTAVSATLPSTVNDQSVVQVRILTTDAVGSDELIGVDDMSITASVADPAPSVSSTSPANGATDVPLNTTPSITFSEPVAVDGSGVTLTCTVQGAKSATLAGGPETYTLTTPSFVNSDTCTIAILAGSVTDLDANDPPNEMAADFAASFSTPGAPPTGVVVSEVYGGGGNSGATLKNDFIELYNTTASPISLAGWSVQYASATGTSWQVTNLSGSIPAGRNYLIQEAQGAAGTADLPMPDATGTISMSGTVGKVALVSTTSALTGSCPTANVVDLVGFGVTASCFEGTGPTPAPSNTTSAQRKGGGATDTNDNAADFTIAAADPHASVDPAPAVASTTPADGATSVARGADIAITFSEPVTVSGSWFTISCSLSGAHTAVVAGGPTTFNLNPDADFGSDETCTVTLLAANVVDQDSDDPPDNMAGNVSLTFATVSAANECDLAFTPIYSIQGSGSSAAITGNITTEGVVVGDFQGPAAVGMQGFYLQDAIGDGDPTTSDGIFVFTDSADSVAAGDVVRVTGYARERFNMTAINATNSNTTPVTNIVTCGTGASLVPVDVTLPVASATFLERYEGMFVNLPQALVISEYFNYDQFGEIVLANPLNAEDRPYTPTSVVEPGPDAIARATANLRSRIILDDAVGQSNPPSLRHPNGDPFSLTNRFRGGDTVTNARGVLSFDFSNYRIMPTGPATYAAVNPRPTAPDPVGGTIRASAMNTLNFFLTLDTTASDSGSGPCGGNANLDCRGADSDQPLEFTRQRDKLLQALVGLDADIIGLNEIENTPGVSPLGDPDRGVVAGLNAILGADTYAFIDTGVIGTDAIRVGLIYKPAKVTPIGSFQILTTSVDPRFIDTKSRPVLAQTFEDNATGGRFTVAVNHLKSKGSACGDVGDLDAGDGQGNCNGTRTLAAQALVDWLATDPTGAGDPDFLILGDLNSYAQEDPIDAIKAGSDDTVGTADDFTNLIATYQGTFAHSYVFDGQAGYLDHALASAGLLAQVTGAADWHIDSDEPDVVDYDTTFKPTTQEALYEPNAYRASDHDPVVVGLNLNAAPTVEAGGPYEVVEGSSITVAASGTDANGDTLTYAWDLDNNGSFESAGQTATFTAPAGSAPSSPTIRVQVSDPLGLTAIDTATVRITWRFTGFFSPLSSPPTENVAKAGSGLPIKFMLGGDQGLGVIAADYPASIAYTCGIPAGSRPTDATTRTSGSLAYDAAAGAYKYTWKTDKSWANTCRRFVLELTDGSVHYLDVHFVK